MGFAEFIIGRAFARPVAQPTLRIRAWDALPRGDRLVAAIVVEAALGLAAEPAGLDVFYQERTGPVLGVRETLMQDLHDRQTGIEADEIGKFKRPHRMVRTELHRGVDRLDVSDPLIQRID